MLACESFHADVHAGNLWLLRDGRIGFLDFGTHLSLLSKFSFELVIAVTFLQIPIISFRYVNMAFVAWKFKHI